MLYIGLRLDYRLRLWTPTAASRAVSKVAELFVFRSLTSLVSRQKMRVVTTGSLAMAERPHELSNFKNVGHFEAKFLVEGLRFAPTSMDRYMENYYTTTLPLDVSTQRNFVADFIRLKLNFI